MITRKTGIPAERLMELERNAPVRLGELEALARLWNCPLSDVLESLPPGLLAD